MITVKNLSKHFGGIKAVDGVDLHIDRGSITGLVGPNGAGKTTMFNLIAGLYQPTEGEIILDGEDVTELTSHQLFHKGLLRTFQIAHEFPTLSVLENLMMVPADQLGENLMNTWLKRKQIREEEKALQAKAEEVVDFLSISHLKNERAGNLSGGQKKLLELGRSLMKNPDLLLLDEPLAGVNPKLAEDLLEKIKNLSDQGITILMVEHNIEAVMKISERVVVLAEGKVIAEGTPQTVRSNDKVIEAYLGTAHE